MRRTDWQSRLAAVIDAKQRDAFAWGQNDCSLFCCDVIAAITDVDPGEPFRGKYDSRLAGTKLLKEHGADNLEQLVEILAARHGFVEVNSGFAQRGDLGLYRDPKEGDTLGINTGPSFAFLMEKGMIYLPRSKMSRCWRIT